MLAAEAVAKVVGAEAEGRQKGALVGSVEVIRLSALVAIGWVVGVVVVAVGNGDHADAVEHAVSVPAGSARA